MRRATSILVMRSKSELTPPMSARSARVARISVIGGKPDVLNQRARREKMTLGV